MGGAPDIPQQNLGQELGQILQFLPKFVQKQYGLAGTYGPQFAQQDIAGLTQQAPQYAQLGLDLTKKFGPQYAQTGFDITKQFAPQYLGLNLDQMKQAIAGSPLLSQMNQQAQGGLTDAYGNLARGGTDALLGQLTNQAQGQLRLGGQMSPEELRNVTQGTLAGFAARGGGLAGGTTAMAQSLLNRDLYSRGRQQERQQFAGNVEQQRQGALGLAQSRLGQAQSFGLGTQAANLQNLGGLGGIAQMPNLAGYAQAPNLAAYAQPGGSYVPMASGLGATSGQASGLLGFGSNLFDANQSAAANQAIGGSNKTSGLVGSGIGLIGSVAGAAL